MVDFSIETTVLIILCIIHPVGQDIVPFHTQVVSEFQQFFFSDLHLQHQGAKKVLQDHQRFEKEYMIHEGQSDLSWMIEILRC